MPTAARALKLATAIVILPPVAIPSGGGRGCDGAVTATPYALTTRAYGYNRQGREA